MILRNKKVIKFPEIKGDSPKFFVMQKIDAPIYLFGDQMINEYELRSLQVMVARSQLSSTEFNQIGMTDLEGSQITIDDEGGFSRTPSGFGLASSFTMDLLRIVRRKRKNK